jgi:hypothetical protein
MRHPRRTRCRVAIAAGFVVMSPGALVAQQVERSATGMRARVEVCADTTAIRSGRHTGELLWHDSASVALSRRDSSAVIPMSHVREVQVNTLRSRELQGLGMLVGLAAGFGSIFLIDDGSENYARLLFLPINLAAGGVLGYFIGGKLSGPEEWQPLALPPTHAAACARSRRDPDPR